MSDIVNRLRIKHFLDGREIGMTKQRAEAADEIESLRQRLAAAEARSYELRQLLETACDAWECTATEHERDYWRMPLLNRDWYDEARRLTTTED